jgi:hypothetical protein
MSLQGYGTDITLVAGADLSATGQFRGVKVNSSGRAILAAAAGEFVIGVLQNNPGNGQAGTVRVAGATKMIAGAAVTAGAVVGVDSTGRVIAATGARTNTSDGGAAVDPLLGTFAIGVALEAAGAAGDVIAVHLMSLGAIPTTAV